MQKLWILASLLLIMLAGACAAATPEPAPETEATQAPAATAVEAATPVAVEPEITPTIVDFAASAPASCTVVSSMPEPDPTQVALFPPVREDDLAFGPPDAAVTILEYSDFQ
jgi:protein-disulfide isomerase